MNNQIFLILAFFAFLMNLYSCYFIREVIWSIVWCEKGGKYRNIRKLKKGQSFISKISMQYLKKYVNNNTKAFNHWICVKNINTVFMLINVFVILILLPYYASLKTFANSYCIVYMVISFVVALCCIIQFDVNRNTKYDRERINKK